MSRFLIKLLASLAATIVLTASVVGVLEARRIDASVHDATVDTLRAQTVLLAELAAPTLARGSVDETLTARLVALGEASSIRYTVIAGNGRVLADSAEDPVRMDDHAGRPEVVAVHNGAREHVVERFSDTLSRELIYLARRIESGGEFVGCVRASSPVAAVDRETAELRSNMLLGVLIAALIASFVAVFAARKLVWPLKEMTAVVTAMARGDFSRRVRVDAQDEIGELASACNSLAAQLSQRIEALAKERQEVVAMLRSMVEGVVATDDQQTVLFINDPARRMLSISERDCIGEKIWRLTPVAGVTAILDKSISGEADVADEIRITEASGDRWFDVQASPLRSDGDQARGAVAVFHDVTELRRLEKIRRDFVANVSHELKTPLTAIRGFVETLLDVRDVEETTRQRFLEKIRTQVDRLNALVSDQLTLAKIEAGDAPIERQRVDLREIVLASVSLAEPVAQQKQIELSVEPGPDAVHVEGDADLLQQALENLLDNAIKYTGATGRVEVRLLLDGDTAVVEVEDTGIGLSTEDQSRVFERFYCVDRARSREVGGTGLGLSIVRNVTAAHGGGVMVDSELGRGSVFRVRLPLAARAAAET